MWHPCFWAVAEFLYPHCSSICIICLWPILFEPQSTYGLELLVRCVHKLFPNGTCLREWVNYFSIASVEMFCNRLNNHWCQHFAVATAVVVNRKIFQAKGNLLLLTVQNIQWHSIQALLKHSICFIQIKEHGTEDTALKYSRNFCFGMTSRHLWTRTVFYHPSKISWTVATDPLYYYCPTPNPYTLVPRF